jgi:hypothetical protein
MIRTVLMLTAFSFLNACILDGVQICEMEDLETIDFSTISYASFRHSMTGQHPSRNFKTSFSIEHGIFISKRRKVELTEKEISALNWNFDCLVNDSGIFHHHVSHVKLKIRLDENRVCKTQFKDIIGCGGSALFSFDFDDINLLDEGEPFWRKEPPVDENAPGLIQ